jgi:gliding motility-associated-like protein
VTVQPTCAVPTGTIVVTAPLGAQYEYEVDLGAYQASPTFTLVAVGNHTVTARLVASPTCVSLASGTLTVNAVPAVPATNAITGLSTLCAGTTGVAYGVTTDNSATATYAWSYSGTNATLSLASGSSITIDFANNATSGILTVIETITATGCSTTNTQVITVNALMPVSVTIVADVNPICAGATVTFTATPTNGGITPSYQWYNGATAVGTNSPAYSYVPTNGDVITVVLTSSETCQSGSPATSNAVTMTVNPIFPVSVSIVADVNPICSGATVTFTATPTNGGISPSYQWYNGATAVGTNSPAYSYVPTNGDVITVVLTSSEICQSGGPATSNAVTMTVNPILPVSITIAADVNPLCSGVTVNFTATPTNGGTIPSYQWYNGVTAVGTNSPAYSYIPTNGDVITVVLTSSETCQSGGPATSNPVTMIVDAVPIVVITNPAAVCASTTFDLTVAAVTAGSTAGLTYTYWSDAAATIAYTSQTVATAGTYYIKGSDPLTGCYDIKPVTVTANPVPTVIITNPAAVCSPTTVDLTVVAVTAGSTAGLTYTYWSDAAATLVYTAQTTATAGTFYIKGIDPVTSCYDIKPVTVTVNPVPTVTITNPAAVCSPSTIDLTVAAITAGSTAGLTYTYWGDAAATIAYATKTTATAGTYYIKGSDPVTGCYDIKPVIVTVNPSPAATTVNVNVACSGGTTGSATVIATGGTGVYTYSWNTVPVQTTATATGLSAATYIVTVTDANLCSTNISSIITEPAAVSISSSKVDASCPGVNDGSIALTITGGTQPYNTIWSDGILTQDRQDIPEGTYSAVVTDKNACASSLDVIVNNAGSDKCIEIPDIITPNNDGFNDTWKIKNIDMFPNAEVYVYTRWGKLVFNSKNLAANPWNGTFKGELLPTDSYHYVLHLNDGSKPRTGVISIIR